MTWALLQPLTFPLGLCVKVGLTITRIGQSKGCWDELLAMGPFRFHYANKIYLMSSKAYIIIDLLNLRSFTNTQGRRSRMMCLGGTYVTHLDQSTFYWDDL